MPSLSVATVVDETVALDQIAAPWKLSCAGSKRSKEKKDGEK